MTVIMPIFIITAIAIGESGCWAHLSDLFVLPFMLQGISNDCLLQYRLYHCLNTESRLFGSYLEPQ